MADINLLQNQLHDTTLVPLKRAKWAVAILGILVALIATGAGILYFFTTGINEKTTELSAANLDLLQQLDEQQAGLSEAKSYQARLNNIDLLLKQHIFISPLLEELSKHTYIRSQYLSFDVLQSTGHIHVQGLVENYNSLGKLLLGLGTSSNIHDVKLLSVQPAGGEVKGFMFSIDMTASPEIFVK